MIVHQIFYDMGLKPLEERPIWLENIRVNKQLNPHCDFKLWRNNEVEEILYRFPEYEELVDSFPHSFYIVDFVRLLILREEGGMYMDLDVRCKHKLPTDKLICGSTYTSPHKVNNNLIRFLARSDYVKCLDFVISEFRRIYDGGLYANWPGRRFFNSVGAGAFMRYCNKNKIMSEVDFRKNFYDGQSCSWSEPGGVLPRDFQKKQKQDISWAGSPPINQMIVHQIFGVLGDTEMNELFQKSHKAYKEFAKKNNYHYKLWNKEECDTLIEYDFPEYSALYHGVRYDIMKVDIVRMLILHKHGGFYADLDTLPNCEKLKSSTFIVANPQTSKTKKYEMEVIQSIPSHPYLLQYLEYVRGQIEEKDKIEVYNKWKCRYVYQTTGPHSFSRFLSTRDDIDTYNINNPDYDKGKSMNLTGKEDFISHISCSYKDKMDDKMDCGQCWDCSTNPECPASS